MSFLFAIFIQGGQTLLSFDEKGSLRRRVTAAAAAAAVGTVK